MPAKDLAQNQLIWLIVAVLLPWLALLQPLHQINHDVAWFYYVARGVLQGGVLYWDFIEPNAPLASLSLTPAVGLAAAFSLSPDWAMELYTLTVASCCMGLCAALLWRLRLPARGMLYAMLALAVAFIALPGSVFGQREHMIAMLLTPYLLGCVAACAGIRLGVALACAIGAAAAVAVGLKPYFVLVPAALELVVLARAGWRWNFRAQPLALAAVLVLIFGATMVFFPRYAHEVVPWAAALYGGYNASIASLAGRVAFVLGAGSVAFLCWRVDGPAASRAALLCLAAAVLAALGAFLLQAKGWLYQLFPCLFFLLLLTAGALAATGVLPERRAGAVARWLAARALALFALLAMIYLPYSSVDLGQYGGLAREISAQKGPFVILSTSVAPGFPLALTLHRTWASRIPCLIMLPGLLKLQAGGAASRWDAVFRGWISEDLQRYKPALVFVPARGDLSLPDDFDILAWLQRDKAFTAAWAQYHADGVTDGYRVFRRS